MAITYVSAFFDIGRKTDISSITFANYFNWINVLLNLPIELYFYTQEDLLPLLQFTPRDNLHIIIQEDIPYVNRISEISKSWYNYQTNCSEKDTPAFAALMISKFAWVKQTLENNSGITHCSWIDAGISKVADRMDLLPFLIPSEQIKCILMNYINKEEINHPNFTKSCKYKIPGGLFGGNRENMLWFSEQIINLGNRLIDFNNMGLEQELMAIIYRKNTDRFSPYYGDFCDLITNYNCCINNKWLPERVRDTALLYNDLSEADRVIRYLAINKK